MIEQLQPSGGTENVLRISSAITTFSLDMLSSHSYQRQLLGRANVTVQEGRISAVEDGSAKPGLTAYYGACGRAAQTNSLSKSPQRFLD